MAKKKSSSKARTKPSQAKATKPKVTRKRAVVRSTEGTTPAAPAMTDTLLALTSVGLKALRTRLTATGAGKRDRSAKARKHQATLAAAMKRLEADYRKVLKRSYP